MNARSKAMARLGSARSKLKTANARWNGKRGGRPAKYPKCERYGAHRFSPKTDKCPCGFVRAENQITGREMPTNFAELFGLLDSDIYTDAPEYSDRVARIRQLLPKVKFSVERLAEYLAEAHAEDKANNHYGDGPDDCSYCDAIADVLSPQAFKR